MQISSWYIRHGFGAVRPYVYGRLDLPELLARAFGARELERHKFDEQSYHVEMQIADSIVVIEASDPPYPSAQPSSIYVYVEDADAAYERALLAGAVTVAAPEDKPNRDRGAGVKDSSGNIWWIGTYLGET